MHRATTAKQNTTLPTTLPAIMAVTDAFEYPVDFAAWGNMTPDGVAVGDDVGVTSRIVAWDAEVMFKPLKLFRDVKNAPLSKAVRSLDITALCVMLLVMFKSYKTFTPVSSPPPFKVACTFASTALSSTPMCSAAVLPTATANLSSSTSDSTTP